MSATVSPPAPRLPILALCLLFLGSLLCFGLTAHGYLENTDTEITMHAARAWWLRGSPGLVGRAEAEQLTEDVPTWPAEQAIVDGYIRDPNLPRYGRIGLDGRGYVWFPIGHQALMVPGIALAQVLDRTFPDVERRFRAQKDDPIRGQFFWERFVLSFLSPLCAAASLIALVLLCLGLGAPPSAALIASMTATFATQFWPGTAETMSDMPGTFFLLAPAALVAWYARGAAVDALLWAGFLGGIGVLCRYPQALPLVGIGAWALWSAIARRRILDAAWFVIGGLVPAALLLYANLWRFGDPAETGYSGGVGFFSYPLHWGLPMILIAFGKGVLWFSIPLWLAFAQLGRSEVRRHAASWFALVTLVAPLPLYATLHYWAAGQCWGIRYLTGVVVLFVAVALAIGRPWERRPLLFWSTTALGFVLSAGGLVTSYTGHQTFAYPAAQVRWDADPSTLNDNVNFDPMFSPLHGHWTYAWLASEDRIATKRSKDTTEPLFGVAMPDAKVPRPRREDTGFRHVFWRYLEDIIPGVPFGPLAAVLAAAAVACLVAGGALLVARTPTRAGAIPSEGAVR
jgi:hypothetical protein